MPSAAPKSSDTPTSETEEMETVRAALAVVAMSAVANAAAGRNVEVMVFFMVSRLGWLKDASG